MLAQSQLCLMIQSMTSGSRQRARVTGTLVAHAIVGMSEEGHLRRFTHSAATLPPPKADIHFRRNSARV